MVSKQMEDILERIALALECIAEKLPSFTEEQGAADFVISHVEVGEEVTPQVPPNDENGVVSRLEPFLTQRGVTVKTIPELGAADQVIDSLSMALGEQYVALSSLVTKIKRAMQTGTVITESLVGKPQLEVSAVCQFCHRLHEIAFLEYYKYYRSPKYLIRAKTTTLPQAQRFFAGQWLERYALGKVKEVHSQVEAALGSRLRLEYMVNPQIVLLNGDDFELDVLAAIGESIFWIEAKTGDYQQYVAKYSRVARVLGLDYDHSIMILPDMALPTCEALSSIFSMTVCNLESFPLHLRNTALQECSVERLPVLVSPEPVGETGRM